MSLAEEIVKAWLAEGRPPDLGEASLENLADTAARVAIVYANSGKVAAKITGLTTREWQALPLALRQRWWLETDYGAKAPSAELRRMMREATDTAYLKKVQGQ